VSESDCVVSRTIEHKGTLELKSLGSSASLWLRKFFVIDLSDEVELAWLSLLSLSWEAVWSFLAVLLGVPLLNTLSK